jgi:substrate import-associated zinc metallohydrolase lipoprotein
MRIMKNIYKYLSLIIFAFIILSCDDEDKLSKESVISLQEMHTSELDEWIYETFTKPYNIEIKYKWEDREMDNNFHVTPPQTEKAEDFLKALLELWIKPYEAEAGTEFIKTYSPKLIYLVGTPQYNADGTMTVGLAEGGRKVTVFNVNDFTLTDMDRMSKAFHTMHHEFAHILHQKVLIPTDFKEISKGDYTGAWYNIDEVNAGAGGFITPYSMSKFEEDWVEIIATILTNVTNSNEKGPYMVPDYDEQGNAKRDEDNKMIWVEEQMSQWTHKLMLIGIGAVRDNRNQIVYLQHPNANEGRGKLLEKIAMVNDYYQSVWNMNLFSLQQRIELAAIKLIEENTKKEGDE